MIEAQRSPLGSSGASAEQQPEGSRSAQATKAGLAGLSYDEQLAALAPPEAKAPTKNQTGIPDSLKAGIESLSGMSLDNVRVHYGSARPAALGASAFAQGNHIHLASGQEQMLPHEAWHVVQQMEGRVRPTGSGGGAVVDDPALEREADTMGAAAASAEQAASPEGLVKPSGGGAGGAIQLGKKGRRQAEVEPAQAEDPAELVDYREAVAALGSPEGKSLAQLQQLVADCQEQIDAYDDLGCNEELAAFAAELVELCGQAETTQRTTQGALGTALTAEKKRLGEELAQHKSAPLYALLAPQTVKAAAAKLEQELAALPKGTSDAAVEACLEAGKSLTQLKSTASMALVAWPTDAAGLTTLLGIPGYPVHDSPATPGRNKREWVLGTTLFVCEAHPYDAGAEDFHKKLHFHVNQPALGLDHARGVPGSYIFAKLYNGWA